MANDSHVSQSSLSPRGRCTMSGYLHKVENRTIGLLARRRYWFSLSDSSNYLYWFKDKDDVACSGRLSLEGAAFTYTPTEKGRFEIHSGSEIHTFEASSEKLRDEWLRVLQAVRKHSRHSTSEDKSDIISLSSGTDDQLVQKPTTSSSSATSNEKMATITKQMIDQLLGPRPVSTDSEEKISNDDYTKLRSSTTCFPIGRDYQGHISSSLPSSTFYVGADGELNDRSMEMPREVVSPEIALQKFASRTGEEIIERPKRAIGRARRSLMNLRDRSCEKCRMRADAASRDEISLEQRLVELQEHSSNLEGMIKVLKIGLLTAQKQVETLQLANIIISDDGLREFLLEKEEKMTILQMENNHLNRRVQELESENRDLDNKVSELSLSIEAFRDSVRTKEELIMRLCEQDVEHGNKEKEQFNAGDAEVPEAILIDTESVHCEVEAQMVFEAAGVHDVNELKDLVDGYITQNKFLNNEIVALHSEVQSLLEIERTLNRKNFDLEACYYQLKSRYLMVLNHFKSPEKPGKIMEPGVLRQLLEEANRPPKQSNSRDTDMLGFYLKGKEDTPSDDLLEIAAAFMTRSNEIVEATKLEQSEEYMNWLQSWDALLVNWVGRALTATPQLKCLVRTGVPPAYRARVWKSLVQFSVKDKTAELGNGYFESMLKKAKGKKEEGAYDSAIKQIDLDLARTLPTNKHFDEPASGKIDMLRRVLYAYRYHNKEVGYCQGLNRLAAVALLYLDEEDAFWFMVACVEYLQPQGYYTSTLIGAVADQKVLRDLVNDKLPKLAAHLRSLEVDLSLFTLSWFLTCFVDILPYNIYLSIFDIFLYEGNKAIFRFALAILKLTEPSVLQCKTIGTVHACLSRSADHVKDFKSLAQVAFNELNPFPQKMIESKRAVYLSLLMENGYR